MSRDIQTIVDAFLKESANLSPAEVLQVSETLLKNAQYSDEIF